MNNLTITTNNVPRDLITFADLTEKEREWFDYVDAEEHYSPRFVRYRGEAYDTHEFVAIRPRSQAVGFQHGVDEDSPLLGWHGIQTDSYFSGTLVRYMEDYERVVVGRYYG